MPLNSFKNIIITNNLK